MQVLQVPVAKFWFGNESDEHINVSMGVLDDLVNRVCCLEEFGLNVKSLVDGSVRNLCCGPLMDALKSTAGDVCATNLSRGRSFSAVQRANRRESALELTTLSKGRTLNHWPRRMVT